jgi:hypothetical protein
MIADGWQAIADRAVLRDQAQLFGRVASDPTAWRLLSDLDGDALARLRVARAAARELAWAQAAETRDGMPASTAAGLPVPGLVLDVDPRSCCVTRTKSRPPAPGRHSATIRCSASWTTPARRCPGYSARAGRGRAPPRITSPSWTRPWPRSPDEHRHGTPILIRADSAGCTYGFLAHIRSLREQVHTFFSVGVAIGEPIRDAIKQSIDHPELWVPALDADGDPRDGAEVSEITGLISADFRASYPAGTRSSCVANALTPVRNCRCSTPSKASATR